MPNIITDGKLEAHRISIRGPEVNETFYVYGSVNASAIKDFLANAETPRATRKPRRAKRTVAEVPPPQAGLERAPLSDAPARRRRPVWPDNQPEPVGSAQ